MWPGFDSRTRRQMWVEFVVGSRPCSERFFPGTPVFPSPQKPTFPIPIRSGFRGPQVCQYFQVLLSVTLVEIKINKVFYGATVFNSNFRPLELSCIRLPRYFRRWKRNAWSLSKAYFYWDRYEFTKIFGNFLERGFQRKCVFLEKWKEVFPSYYSEQVLEPQRFQGPSFK